MISRFNNFSYIFISNSMTLCFFFFNIIVNYFHSNLTFFKRSINIISSKFFIIINNGEELIRSSINKQIPNSLSNSYFTFNKVRIFSSNSINKVFYFISSFIMSYAFTSIMSIMMSKFHIISIRNKSSPIYINNLSIFINTFSNRLKLF